MAEDKKVRKKKKRRKKNYLLRIFVFAVICAALYFFLNMSFFDVSKIAVKNNNYYTSEQLIEKGGVKTGENIFFESKTGKIKKALLQDPYIKNVNV